MPSYLVPHLSGAWKAVDAIEHPITWAHTVDVIARPSLNVRRAPTTAAARVASLPHGRDVATTTWGGWRRQWPGWAPRRRLWSPVPRCS